MKPLIFSILCLNLAACSQVVYTKPGAMPEQVSQDYADCDYEASLATASIYNLMDRATDRHTLIAKCMLRKNYYEERIPL